MKTLLVSLAALLLAAPCACAADVFSEDFEQGAGRWQLPSKQWRVANGEGLDGSRALALEYAKDEMPVWIEGNEMFRVEPGEAYRIEAWVNDSAFQAKDRPISISFAVYDEKNRLLRGGGTGSKRVIDNIIRKDGFYRVEGTTRPLPANAYRARFYIWAKEGSYGCVRFDGFRAYKVAVNPVEPLVCSAYRDEAAEGEVRFSAGYAVNGLKHDIKQVHAELWYVTPGDGHPSKRSAKATLSEGVASVTLPVASFAFGTNEVRMVLKEGDKALGESSCMFARVVRLPERKVWIDAHKRTIVDGKPFFPLGMFWGDITAADLATYTNGTLFNCLMPYRRPDAAKLDLCAAADVKVIYPIAGWYADFAGTNTQKAAMIDAKYVRGTVAALRSHPAILAWYLADELIVPYARQLEDRNRMCREVDPDHPTWICQNTTASVRPFVNGYDAIGMDTYPVGNPSGRRDIAIAHGMAAEAVRQMYGARAMWHVPQSFDWSHYAKDQYAAQAKGWKPPPDMRMPTVEEMRSIAWQSVAAGANGLIFYSYMDIMKRGRSEDVQRKQWLDTCVVVREVKEKEAVLLSEPGPVPAEVPKGIVCRTWRTSDGKVHLLACNTTRTAVKGTVRVDGSLHNIELPPIGVKIQELELPRSIVNAPSGAEECVSGIYPHLAMFNDEGECGTGAVVPWAGDLWVMTYGPHCPLGSSDKLYRIKPDLTRETFAGSVGGTHANRMIHRETNQLLIGPYVIDATGGVRVIPPMKMPGRLTANARHLSYPSRKAYYATMEAALFEVDLDTLEVNTLIRDDGGNKWMFEQVFNAGNVPKGWYGAPIPKLPGYHGKGMMNGFGKIFYANNGEPSKEARLNPFVPSGALGWWNTPGDDWHLVRRCQFTEVTSPDGIYGNEHPAENPVWAMGWDAKSVILGVTTNGVDWAYYRLPKASHCYDGAHGWNTEWPRIRDVGFGDGTLLATMHGTFWRFPRGFSPANPNGIRPISTYLKVIGDFCRWGDRIVFGCDDQAKDEFLGKRGLKKGAPRCEKSQSNLWFVKPEDLKSFGPPSGEGYVWLNEDVKAGDLSEPYLHAGYESMRLRFTAAGGREVPHELVVEGDWVRVRCLADATKATACFRYGPKECEIPALDKARPCITVTDEQGKAWRFPNVNGDVNVVCREIVTERDLLYVGGVWYEVPADNAGGFAALRPIALADEAVKTLRGERGILYLNDKAMAIDDLWKNGSAPVAYWLWEKR